MNKNTICWNMFFSSYFVQPMLANPRRKVVQIQLRQSFAGIDFVLRWRFWAFFGNFLLH